MLPGRPANLGPSRYPERPERRCGLSLAYTGSVRECRSWSIFGVRRLAGADPCGVTSAPVSARRVFAASLMLVVAMSIETVHGAPARVTAQLRATWCCATTCPRDRRVGAANHCCHVSQSGSEVAVVAGSTDPSAPPTDCVRLATTPSGSTRPMTSRLIPRRQPRTSTAPPFLLTHALRI